eukprot:gene5729-9552_t
MKAIIFLILSLLTYGAFSNLLQAFLTYKPENDIKIQPTNSNYPVWPLSFNVTLLKLNYIDKSIRWTKLFYDFKNQRSKFEFYDGYVDKEGKWGKKTFEIFFFGKTVWYLDVKSNSCRVRSRNLPSISPHWLRTTKLNKKLLFRDQWAEEWEFPENGPLKGMKYWARVGKNNDERFPLRSTNQEEDPGDTDYVDFVVGAQNDALFKVPSICPP